MGSATRADWRDDGENVISFRRGRGWVAFNNDPTAQQVTVQTGLHRGRYCDLVTGHRTASGCTGTTVVVDSAGRTTLTVPAKGAVAVTRRR